MIFKHSDRARAYSFLIDKKAKVMTIKAKKLNHAGRLTYMRSITNNNNFIIDYFSLSIYPTLLYVHYSVLQNVYF